MFNANWGHNLLHHCNCHFGAVSISIAPFVSILWTVFWFIGENKIVTNYIQLQTNLSLGYKTVPEFNPISSLESVDVSIGKFAFRSMIQFAHIWNIFIYNLLSPVLFSSMKTSDDPFFPTPLLPPSPHLTNLTHFPCIAHRLIPIFATMAAINNNPYGATNYVKYVQFTILTSIIQHWFETIHFMYKNKHKNIVL